uniref:Uncharacterized protein n=1 Tax=Rousettus aegyptiacus TaxID=9407 RepID=A0A7J8D6V0_ROUAE|nr:hypothetical protein HJG63_008889 [Rousettus aegyptiacus]
MHQHNSAAPSTRVASPGHPSQLPPLQAKCLKLYLACDFGMLTRKAGKENKLSHFLCPCQNQGQAPWVLTSLWPGALASCPLVLHIFSLGGYTFAQMLLLMSQNPGRQSSVAQCLRGSLDHMALGECARVRMRGLLVT